MTEALDALQRDRLERLVGRLRRILEADLGDQAAGQFGLDLDGSVADERDLRLDPTALAARRQIVDVVAHLQSEGDTAWSAVARLIREAVFTHLNRLVAIRIAEALGLLRPSMVDGRGSKGFRDVLELAPLLAGDDTGGYWTYLQLCGDELAAELPTLFDPRNPLLALAPSPGALDDLVEGLADASAAELWTAPDCLGWVYQFFNTSEERRTMREESSAPRDSRELAVRNQFFTPRYVVDFLVQNSLGRRLLAADPASSLLDDLPLLVNPPTTKGEPISLNEVSVLDPACGSGHFLLAAYDVLERAWHHADVNAAEAAPLILASLWGIDIDPRCSQVAAAALIFRARRSCTNGVLPRPNVICARALPLTSTGLDGFLHAIPDAQRYLVERFTEALSDAPVLGSLLRIEERLATEVRHAAFGGAAGKGTLADAIPNEVLQGIEDHLLASLTILAANTTARPAERILAAEAEDAVRFVRAMQRRYDAIVMNPPFGAAVPSTRPYLESRYGAASRELAAAFGVRVRELLKPAAVWGALMTRQVLFLDSLEDWRRTELLGAGQLKVLLDLGVGVLTDALVEVAAVVCHQAEEVQAGSALFVNLLDSRTKDSDVRLSLATLAKERLLQDFRSFPKAAMPYWLPPELLRQFDRANWSRHGVVPRTGYQTDDDFKLLRLLWELPPLRPRDKYVPVSKGGEYDPYWSDIHLAIDWQSWDRRPADLEEFRRGGLTYSYRTTSDVALRILPRGCGYLRGGPAVYGEDDKLLVVLAACYSRPFKIEVEAIFGGGDSSVGGSAARNYSAPWLGSIPIAPLLGSDISSFIAERAASAARRTREVRSSCDETSPYFVAPWYPSATLPRASEVITKGVRAARDNTLGLLDEQLELTKLVEASFTPGLGLSAQMLVDLWGQLPTGDRTADLNCTGEVAALWGMTDDELVEEAVKSLGASRPITKKSYFGDRRLELMIRLCRMDNATIRGVLDAVPPTNDERRAVGNAIFSYLVGCALGRWDTRIGGNTLSPPPAPGLFEALPITSPGMLVGFDGTNLSLPPEYEFALPPARLLVDQPGHGWDIETRVTDAASVLFGEGEVALGEILKALGRKTVRDYLRRQFFKDHLSRYSRSRRQAPIYWPLYVPSGAWGTWVYAPAFKRETLFAIAKVAADRLDAAETEIRLLQRERDSGGGGRSVREVANALESE